MTRKTFFHLGYDTSDKFLFDLDPSDRMFYYILKMFGNDGQSERKR